MVRRFAAWMVLFLGGVITVLLGLLIVLGWPASSFWVIGLFIGVDLLMDGVSWVALGLAARGMRTAATGTMPQAG
jgi:uncharacterized membrane protein HdeD (DUF308 family)